jgi:hypothetical protein
MKNLSLKCIENFQLCNFFLLKVLNDVILVNFYPWESISHFKKKSFAWIFLSITCLGIFIGWFINIYD